MILIEDALINEIHDGNCVAFVGAGFSALFRTIEEAVSSGDKIA